MLTVVVTGDGLYHLVRHEADMAASAAPMKESHFHHICKPRFLLAEPPEKSCG
jgi:hypothetical protein